MNRFCVRTEKLSKSFFIYKRKKTSLQIVKSFAARQHLKERLWALRDLSLEVARAQKVAIVGENGSGKTTLLRLISGIYDKTSGSLQVCGEPKGLLSFWVGLNANLSVADNVYLLGAVFGITRAMLRQRVDRILEWAELDSVQFTPLKELSSGQRQRLALGVFFETQGDLFLLDESLSSVDKGFAQKCETRFDEFFHSDKTVIMASHDTAFLKKYCSYALWLKGGELHMAGPAQDIISRYEASFLGP